MSGLRCYLWRGRAKGIWIAAQFLSSRQDGLSFAVERCFKSQYTEEETKIIGTIRSAQKEDEIFARRVADDVGCYVQKVAKFGERLEKLGLVAWERHQAENKLIYFAIGAPPQSKE